MIDRAGYLMMVMRDLSMVKATARIIIPPKIACWNQGLTPIIFIPTSRTRISEDVFYNSQRTLDPIILL